MRVDPSSREYSSPALRVMSAASVSESRAIARARAPMESVISLSHTPTISETWDRRPAQCARSFHGEAASSKAHALTDERWVREGMPSDVHMYAPGEKAPKTTAPSGDAMLSLPPKAHLIPHPPPSPAFAVVDRNGENAAAAAAAAGAPRRPEYSYPQPRPRGYRNRMIPLAPAAVNATGRAS
ncbi:hypothetical protein AXG93_2090s1040 [Marchantia polymorpha subsp. ruderalis]|uniref:Uncharacterized protein n=1 Tax=Marchantia polymorpha subsp. ruderalis TaxID=1480154 RepID=A0A176W8G3_MARPO|nr:hypothetical protein AXG93_2090s1040 [Marchantia polymorpha subsp. ruderalis]